MMRRFTAVFILPALLAAALVGCGAGTNPAKETPKGSAAKGAGTVTDDLPGLKELNEADRKQAETQKNCPVSGELLGSMGKPFKMKLNGREIFLCCDGCEEEVKKDPDKYLKKLDALLPKKIK